MMGNSFNFQEVEEEDQFFDSREDISSVTDSCPGSPENHNSCPNEDFMNWVSSDPQYELWIGKPDSIQERRDKFMKRMGLDLMCSTHPDTDNPSGEVTLTSEIMIDIDRVTSNDGAVLRSSNSTNQSSMSSWSSETSCTSKDRVSVENFECKNLDYSTMFAADELEQDGSLRILGEVGSSRMLTFDELERSLCPSSSDQQPMRRENALSNCEKTVRRRSGWLRRLGEVACIVDRQGEESNLDLSDGDQSGSARVQRIRVRPYKKQSKEFSAVYMGQDIIAHEGAILTMKFSPDGKYLASGGEDGVVRVWSVMECERTEDGDVPEDDPSCLYLTVNHNSELSPIYVDKEKKGKSRSMRRTSDSACVIIPPEVFRISEKPLHEFHGHDADVLDLSWSKNKHLLSSSMDKSVRLWRIGCDSCLKVFSHNNYVTCIQFNPVDENYFISGSIDGKVRIWEIPGCQVVDWTDITEIVTAVCYRPDGKGAVVGSMTGDCRFYDASDNQLQLDAQISLPSKKKSPYKRITGFQFSPSDHRKLMVTSADSQVRVLDGVDVFCKYKGFRNAGSQMSASWTSDGRHIISASEDSTVYVWSHIDQGVPPSNQVKSIWSCERFFSSNASVAIPWQGLESRNPSSVASVVLPSQQEVFRENGFHGNNTQYLSPSGSFTLSHEFFSEVLPKGSATWPEEKLPSSSMTVSALGKSQYKFLKTSCQNASHAWGQVIVTAGWDGRIRSFYNYGLPVHV